MTPAHDLPPVVRAFAAIALPDGLRRTLGQLLERVAAVPGSRSARLRWTRPDNLHVTLKFLARVETEQLAELEGDLDRLAARAGGPLRLTVSGAGCFPPAGKPKVLWLGLGGDVARLAALATALDQGLEARGFAREQRPFAPHLTVARVTGSAGGGDAHGTVAALDKGVRALASDFVAPELLLFRSETLPEGARYTVLHRTPLG